MKQINAGNRTEVWTRIRQMFETSSKPNTTQVIFIQEIRQQEIANAIMHKANCKSPRAGILMDKNFSSMSGATVIADFSNRDQVAVHVKLKISAREQIGVILCSLYLPHKDSNKKVIKAEDIVPRELENLVKYCNENKIHLLIGSDSNAHCSELWRSTSDNDRGKTLSDFIRINDLIVHNVGNTPTFYPHFDDTRSSVIDITLSDRDFAEYLRDWQVDVGYSESDHRWISWNLDFMNFEQKLIYNKRRTNWKKYYVEVKNLTNLPSLSMFCSIEEAEEQARAINKILFDAFDKANKKTKSFIPVKNEWFTEELKRDKENILKTWTKAKNAGKKANKTDDPIIKQQLLKTAQALWDEQRKLRDAYRKRTRKSSHQNFDSKMEKISKAKDIARIQKFFENGKTQNITTLVRNDGTCTRNIEETIECLLETHFPDCTVLNENDEWPERYVPPQPRNREEIREIMACISIAKIKSAIESFSPYKASGMDLVFPAMLQKAKDLLAPILQPLFRACLRLSYIPTCWRGTFVTFIPKPGKSDYANPKSYRGICLTSFIAKTMEKLIDRKIRNVDLANNELDDSQHAYRENRSTDSALHNFTTFVESSFSKKYYNLSLSVDITGAFDCVTIDAIIKAARAKNIAEWTIDYIASTLRNRRLMASNEHCKVKITPNIGSPQGGALSPILWCLVMDPLLAQLRADGALHSTGYADDLITSTHGNKPYGVCQAMTRAIKIIEQWCTSTGLKANPSKTQLILFTNNRSEVDYFKNKIKMGGQTLQLVSEIKYLGVYFDRQLNMKRHLQYLEEKANKTLYAAKAIIHRRYGGFKPKTSLYVVKNMLNPRLTYGSIVFWHKTQPEVVGYKGFCERLDKILRNIALMITGATHSAPTSSLLAMTGLIPLHILITQRAIETYHRLQNSGAWLHLNDSLGHKAIQNISSRINLPNYPQNGSYWLDGKLYMTDSAGSARPNRWAMIDVFTDASVRSSEVGIGVYCSEPKIEISRRLQNGLDINSAEVYAITAAAEFFIDSSIINQRINIWSDSKEAIRMLSSDVAERHATLQCYNILNRLAQRNLQVSLYWLPKRINSRYQIEPDRLARKALLFLTTPLTVNPEAIVKDNISMWLKTRLEAHWLAECTEWSNGIINGFNDARFNNIWSYSKKELRLLTFFITNHAPLNNLLYKFGASQTSSCRFCELEDEKISHLLMECQHPTILNARVKLFRTEWIQYNDLMSININAFLSFARKIRLDEITHITLKNNAT